MALKRSLSFTAVVFYGVGAILGAGIYVLIGELAGTAGYLAPIAFLLAAVIAGFSALSYAELSARFPFSAGEAVYVQEAFHSAKLTSAIGLMVVFTGVVSTATMAVGAIGYTQLFVDLPGALIVTLFIGLTGVIAIWGINQSALVVGLITLVEVGGLLYVMALSADRVADFPITAWVPEQTAVAASVNGLLLGSFLAFYAFIGFEDMVNIAEEIKRPERVLPVAIPAALVIATLLYMGVAFAALSVLSPRELANSSAPLAKVVAARGGNAIWIGLISLVAVINGAIVQMIMASRVIYGLAAKGSLPAKLATIHAVTRTPVLASVVVIGITLLLALTMPLGSLAQATSFIILAVFLLVNAALIRIKAGSGEVATICYPMAVPLVGLLLCLLALGIKIVDLLLLW